MTSNPKLAPTQAHATHANPAPNWRDLAQATAAEQDPAKVLERARELIRALDAESQERMEHCGKHHDKAAS
jgi:hypothetical protein